MNVVYKQSIIINKSYYNVKTIIFTDIMPRQRIESTSSSLSSSLSSLCEDFSTTSSSAHHATETTQTAAPSSTATRLLSQPNENDIVCGRGKSISAHSGNLKFRHMILARRDEYQATFKRDDKSRITAEIVQALRAGPYPSRYVL